MTTNQVSSPCFQGCQGYDPVAEIRSLESLVVENVNKVQEKIDQAHAIGSSILSQKCGAGNQIDAFFSGAEGLEGHLRTVMFSLRNAIHTLECPKINALYASAVEDSVCTEVASANASGFVLFFIVGICNMVMISLRASWRQPENTPTS